MSPEFQIALTTVTKRVTALAAEDAAFRSDLHTLVEALLGLLEHQEVQDQIEPEPLNQSPAPEPTPAPVCQQLSAQQVEADQCSESELPTKPSTNEAAAIENRLSDITSRTQRYTPASDADLPLIETNCRLKADGARWAAQRVQLIDQRADFAAVIAPRDRVLIDRAKAANCFLWMCRPESPVPDDLSKFGILAGCFETVAESVRVVKAVIDSKLENAEILKQTLSLVAEAQSALFAAVRDIGALTDSDQLSVFNWVKQKAEEERVFIDRFLRIDDPADPSTWPNISDRLKRLDAQLQELKDTGRKRQKLFNKLQHLSDLARSADDSHDQWPGIAATIEALVQEGVPPSSLEIRAMLLPVIEKMPEIGELPQGLQLVHREILRFLATKKKTKDDLAVEPLIDSSPLVDQVAKLLRGRSILLIGGHSRPEAKDALESAFKLSRLMWIEPRPGQSASSFESLIAQPDIVAVLLAVRWSKQSLKDVKKFCARHGKPLVRLPGGYGPNQVAAQIVQQCGQRLARSSTKTMA